MKKRLLLIACAVALLLGLRALAAGGTPTDPLISVSYLMNTFFPQLQTTIEKRAEGEISATRGDTLDKIDALGSGAMSGGEMAGWSYSAHYKTLDVKRGDTLTLYPGSGILWTLGRGTTQVGLVSVTTASEPAEGAELEANHRYLNGWEQPMNVTVISDAARVSVEGYYMLTRSDEVVTPFVDLTKSTDWFYDAAQFSYEKGLLTGTSSNVFAPYVTMNRAMLVTVLYRLAGSPEVEYTGKFPDVPEGEWFTAPIEWAASYGIVKGYDDDTCRPYATLTRENTLVMLYRFAGNNLGLDVSERADLSGFADSDKVNAWAADAVPWAVSAGVISGSSGSIRPTDDAIRAEVASMLKGMLTWAGMA